jgi:outer membrane autotransporter protein
MGVEVKGEKEGLGWNIGIGVKKVLRGEEVEIRSKIIGTGVEMKTRGVEVGAMEIGGELGGEYKITEKLEVYAEVNISKANRYKDIGGNVGIRYSF